MEGLGRNRSSSCPPVQSDHVNSFVPASGYRTNHGGHGMSPREADRFRLRRKGMEITGRSLGYHIENDGRIVEWHWDYHRVFQFEPFLEIAFQGRQTLGVRHDLDSDQPSLFGISQQLADFPASQSELFSNLLLS